MSRIERRKAFAQADVERVHRPVAVGSRGVDAFVAFETVTVAVAWPDLIGDFVILRLRRS